MRTLIAAGGLLPAGTVSIAIRAIFPRSYFSWSLSEKTKKSNSLTNNQLAPPGWRRAIQTESRQTPMFDSGGFTDRPPACPFLGWWRALLCGVVFVWAPDGTQGWSVFCGRRMVWNIIFRERYKRFVTPYILRLIVAPSRSQADTRSRQSPTARGYVSCGHTRMSGNAMERGA